MSETPIYDELLEVHFSAVNPYGRPPEQPHGRKWWQLFGRNQDQPPML